MDAFRVAFVDGVTVAKWARIWTERLPEVTLDLLRTDDAEQLDVLRQSRADMAFVRLPVDDDALHVIPLYAERAFVVVAKEHPIALFDTVTRAELDGEDVLDGSDDDAFALAAAGAGVLIVPQSIFRLRSRRDVVGRPVVDAPETTVGLAWRAEAATGLTEEFIGIVRGRTARSSRGATPGPTAEPSRRRSSQAGGRRTAEPRTGARQASGRRSRPGKR